MSNAIEAVRAAEADAEKLRAAGEERARAIAADAEKKAEAIRADARARAAELSKTASEKAERSSVEYLQSSAETTSCEVDKLDAAARRRFGAAVDFTVERIVRRGGK